VTTPAGAGVKAQQAAQAMRFALPWRTQVVVIDTDGASLPDLGRARALSAVAPDPIDGLVERLAAARADGCEFALLPRGNAAEEELLTALEAAYTPVIPDAAGYAVFSLHPRPPAESPDGLPLPPAHLIRVTSGCLRQAVNRPEALHDSYLEAGAQGAACITSALERFGMALADFGSVLDFGCGCGRVIRHWRNLDATVRGCEYNPLLVDWCAGALPFAQFERNALEPPLPYADESFDFLYAISIFTHLDSGQQVPWMRELARVVRPGGVLLVTVGGASRAERQLNGEDLARFRAGELVVLRADLAGTNACAAWHPLTYIEETLAGDLELVGVIPDGAQDVRQDQVLLRKPAEGGVRG